MALHLLKACAEKKKKSIKFINQPSAGWEWRLARCTGMCGRVQISLPKQPVLLSIRSNPRFFKRDSSLPNQFPSLNWKYRVTSQMKAALHAQSTTTIQWICQIKRSYRYDTPLASGSPPTVKAQHFSRFSVPSSPFWTQISVIQHKFVPHIYKGPLEEVKLFDKVLHNVEESHDSSSDLASQESRP